jgi:Glycosyl transferase family 2
MNEPLPISILLLARNEAGELEALLPRLGFAAELVVVFDPRGDEATRGVIRRHGARLIEHAFEGFGAQRQFALAQCTQEWVLWIDADERPDAELIASLPEFLRELKAGVYRADTNGLRFVRRTWFLGRRIRFCGWGDEWILRLFRRERARFDDAEVHERVHVEGKTLDLEGTIEHHSYETFEACIDKMVRYAHAGAEQAWRQGRRAGPLDVALRPPLRFFRQYVAQAGFLDGARGLVLCAFAAGQVLLKYAELWDRSRRARSGELPASVPQGRA